MVRELAAWPEWLQLVAGLALLLVVLLWVLLPFAVFGIKSRLDRLNATAADILQALRALSGAAVTCPACCARNKPAATHCQSCGEGLPIEPKL